MKIKTCFKTFQKNTTDKISLQGKKWTKTLKNHNKKIFDHDCDSKTNEASERVLALVRTRNIM